MIISMIGDRPGASYPYEGVLRSLILDDLLTPANNQTYIFEGGETDYQLSDEGSVGSELVTNGTFDTSDGWFWLPTWVIANGVISGDGSPGRVYSNTQVPVTLDETYLVSMERVTVTGGTVYMMLGSDVVLPSSGTVGTEYGLYTHSGTSEVTVRGSSFVGTVDNVSVKSIDKAVVFTGIDASNWSQGDGLMQLMLDDTYSAETTFDNSFGSGDLTVGENIRDLKRWNETTIEAQTPKLNQIQLTEDGEPVYNNGYPVYE